MVKNILTAIFVLLTVQLNAQDKPNVIVFLVDDLGYKDVGFTGSDYYLTPNIDKLADQSMVFNQSYMTPTCIASRASLLTGQYSPRTGIYAVEAYARTPDKMQKIEPIHSKKELDAGAVTIAEVLQQNGYVTGVFGKWHLGEGPDTGPLGQGFDTNVAGGRAGSPQSYFSPYGLTNIIPKKEDEYLTNRLTKEAMSFIKENRDEPFFLYFPFYSVHVPLHAQRQMVRKYVGVEPDGQQNNPVYGAMVSTVDQSIGRIMRTLRDFGLEENTIVIFTSDNGGQTMVTSNAPLKGQKGNVYEGGIRVPTFIKWPGQIAPGTVSQELIAMVDYFPTLMSMAGLEISSDLTLDGLDLTPLLTGKTEALGREAIYWHVPNYHGNGNANARIWQFPASVIRDGNWKLIQNLENRELELYNLKADPSESTNLASSNPEKAQQLLHELKLWQQKVGAPLPENMNPNFDPASREWIQGSNQRIYGQADMQTIVK